MSDDNSFKKKIRRRQKATGSSYMRARREMDNSDAGAVGGVPASADAAQMWSLLDLGGGATVPDIAALWATRALPVGTGESVNLEPLFRVPLGLGADGAPVWLDLKDEADGGRGPHLLLAGMTGSGKTVALQSMLGGLCAQHSPDLLQLVLVEAKGGEFAGFADYPHTAAILGPGDSDCGDGLSELIAERGRAVHAAGVDHIGGYRQLRASVGGADLPALPDVFVAVEEFRVLQCEVAGFADVLDMVMRKGRSLGIHVIAVSQSCDAPVVGDVALRANCRIVLRTNKAEGSTWLVGNADACELPRGVGLYSPAWGVEAVPFRGFSTPRDLISDLGRRLVAVAEGA